MYIFLIILNRETYLFVVRSLFLLEVSTPFVRRIVLHGYYEHQVMCRTLFANACQKQLYKTPSCHFYHALSLKFEFVFTAQVHACECRRTCLCENVTVCKRYGFFSVLAAIIQKNSDKPWRPWIENGEGFIPQSDRVARGASLLPTQPSENHRARRNGNRQTWCCSEKAVPKRYNALCDIRWRKYNGHHPKRYYNRLRFLDSHNLRVPRGQF